ncbi:MAG: H-NS histone family protein [Burkholderiaceae bacterium]|nr:H-NS histone family protein [Burkholderiaceae bacterium]
MTVEQLRKLQVSASEELKKREKAEKRNALKAIRELAEARGFSLDELFEEKQARAQRTKGVAKYRNPADASQTWTGRGRKPVWVLSWLAAGKSIEKLAI